MPTQLPTQPKAINYLCQFCPNDVDPFDTVNWRTTDCELRDFKTGKRIWHMDGAEVPETWTDQAATIVASKYFYRGDDRPETSVRQLIQRVVDTFTAWARESGVFADEDSLRAWSNDLAYLLLHQMYAFNSPVWFNVGVREKPQCHACFILSVDDTMESIMELADTEVMLFRYGSGCGTNLGSLRSSKEAISGGGQASGPLSFMRGYDAFAAATKSGGKTRRAAKMQLLNADHPDIEGFINAKRDEELKAVALMGAGYDDTEAYDSVSYQNANFSVTAPDAFMHAAVEGKPWTLRGVHDKSYTEQTSASDLLGLIAKRTWECADPGLAFIDRVNDHNTVAHLEEIKACNPCAEYWFLNDTACNLGSVNLVKFLDENNQVDAKKLHRAVSCVFIAHELVIEHAGYPHPVVEERSRQFRTVGVGFANLGAMLMRMGLPYESESARGVAGAITSIISAGAYEQSAHLAARFGPFEGYDAQSFDTVMYKHHDAAASLAISAGNPLVFSLASYGDRLWHSARALIAEHGVRNAQATALAPTGTIAFMMDCDTTGIEPDFALIKHKKLAGGGTLKIVNRSVPQALRNLGYTDTQVSEIEEYLRTNEHLEGAPHLHTDHLAVFDVAVGHGPSGRAISYRGHIEMMAACQPFVSGAISKTVNMPKASTVEDIRNAYILAWRLGLKAVSIYRDGSKGYQPLNTGTGDSDDSSDVEVVPADHTVVSDIAVSGEGFHRPKTSRRALPDDRDSITHKFSIAGYKGYLTVGLYDDGTPGELFIRMANQGTFVNGAMDTLAKTASVALQYGTPLGSVIAAWKHQQFEPHGITGDSRIRIAKSVVDYVARYLELKFTRKRTVSKDTGPVELAPVLPETTEVSEESTGNPCPSCGTIMVRTGKCNTCPACGTNTGCG